MRQGEAKLRKAIKTADFALYETVLYLDGHPTDEKALHYYHRMKKRSEELTKQYEECYGPLTICGVTAKEEWTWVRDPWPWEYDCRP